MNPQSRACAFGYSPQVMFEPMTDPKHLPMEGSPSANAREKHDLDFKEFADPRASWEHAKDIAAFANSLGGTIIVGGTDKPKVKYEGLKGQTYHDVKDIYEHAGTMCSPHLEVDVLPITVRPGVEVAAVNIKPYAEGPVGAPDESRDKNGKPTKSENGWRFPIRRSSQTKYLTPMELPLFMNPAARRAYVRLKDIQGRRDVTLEWFIREFHNSGPWLKTQHEVNVVIHGVSDERNYVELLRGSARAWVPLADVVEVWVTDTRPYIRVRGTFTEGPWTYQGLM